MIAKPRVKALPSILLALVDPRVLDDLRIPGIMGQGSRLDPETDSLAYRTAWATSLLAVRIRGSQNTGVDVDFP